MWKDSIRNIVVIFQPNILRIVGFYVRHSAYDLRTKLRPETDIPGLYLTGQVNFTVAECLT